MRKRASNSLRAAACPGLTALTVVGLPLPAYAVDFGTGNVAVYRVAGTSTTTASAVFVDEFTPTGALVRSIALPTTTVGSNFRLTARANTSEGMMTRSGDRSALVVTGYDAATASTISTTTASANRVVGTITCATVIDTSTGLSVPTTNPIRGAYSTNGTKLWVFGDNDAADLGGVYFTTVGSSTGTQIIPAGSRGSGRHLEAFGGQLYMSTSGSGITGTPKLAAVGTGLPETPSAPFTNQVSPSSAASPSPPPAAGPNRSCPR